MPPQSSAVLPATAASVQPPATTQYSAEHLAVIKLMAVMTALAVALMVVVTRWFADLDAVPGPLADSLMAEGSFRVVGGAIGILAMSVGMLVIWVRLVKRLVRMDWIG